MPDDRLSLDARYPIGQFVKPANVSASDRAGFVARLHILPVRLRDAVRGLSAEQLETPYRDDGWTVRQVVHHLGDSHMNAIVRCKLGLTETAPVVRPYDENLWLTTGDARAVDIEEALAFVDALHKRFAAVAASVDDQSAQRTIVHPESGEFTLAALLAQYAWHGDHHVAHITTLRAQRGW